MVVEGDDPLEICVRISGSEGERINANVIIADGTATGMYSLCTSNICVFIDALELCELNCGNCNCGCSFCSKPDSERCFKAMQPRITIIYDMPGFH